MKSQRHSDSIKVLGPRAPGVLTLQICSCGIDGGRVACRPTSNDHQLAVHLPGAGCRAAVYGSGRGREPRSRCILLVHGRCYGEGQGD